MDLDFIEEQYREDILKLMEMCGIDMMEAYQLYQNAGHSFQNAVNMQFGKQDFSNQPQDNEPSPYYEEPPKEKEERYFKPNDFDEEYENYKAFKQSGLTFTSKYAVRREQSYISSFIPKFMKSEPQCYFKKLIEQFIGKVCRIKYMNHTLSESIQKYSWKEKFPIIIHILNFQPNTKPKLIELFKDSSFIDYSNIQFKTIGIHPTQYNMQDDLKNLINMKEEKNTMILLRVNVCDEIEILDRVKFMDLSVQDIVKKLKLAKNACINKEIEETHLQKRYVQELMGNYDYKKPVSIAEKRQIAEDRIIRKKQEEQFMASMKAEEEKRLQREQKQEEKAKIKSEEKSKEPAINWAQKREEMRKTIKIYDSGMTIKLRVPSGESMMVTVPSSEKVDYLYNYIFSMQKDLGFESEERKFNIMRPYDQLSLSDHIGKNIKDVFEDSDMESLIVNEK